MYDIYIYIKVSLNLVLSGDLELAIGRHSNLKITENDLPRDVIPCVIAVHFA